MIGQRERTRFGGHSRRAGAAHTGPGKGSRSRGFTIVELMVVLTLILVGTVIGLSFGGDWYTDYRFSGLVRNFEASVNTVKMRAITQQEIVRLYVGEWRPEWAKKVAEYEGEQFVQDEWKLRWGVKDFGLKDLGNEFYFTWMPKRNAEGQPEVNITPGLIAFNSRGFVINPVSYKVNPQVMQIVGHHAKRTVVFTLTPTGRILRGVE